MVLLPLDGPRAPHARVSIEQQIDDAAENAEDAGETPLRPAARALAVAIAAKIAGYVKAGMTVGAGGLVDGGVALVVDHLAARRRIVVECAPNATRLLIKRVDDFGVARREVALDRDAYDPAADFAWILGGAGAATAPSGAVGRRAS